MGMPWSLPYRPDSEVTMSSAVWAISGGVLVADQRAVAGDEPEQVWHLLEVAGHVRVVPAEVHVVELDVDDVADRVIGPEGAAGRAAGGRGRRGGGGGGRGGCGGCGG